MEDALTVMVNDSKNISKLESGYIISNPKSTAFPMSTPSIGTRWTCNTQNYDWKKKLFVDVTA
jgi:hypothetical protein